jgi:hypothetical protein|tara:strand:- start:1566 stop:1796 length:231 start_codon:yes stop_codon:yes gene_type:complete
MSTTIALEGGDGTIEISKEESRYRVTINHKRNWIPFQKRKTEIILEQDQIEQLATYLNNQSNSFPRGNIDFGTSME